MRFCGAGLLEAVRVTWLPFFCGVCRLCRRYSQEALSFEGTVGTCVRLSAPFACPVHVYGDNAASLAALREVCRLMPCVSKLPIFVWCVW